MKKRSRNVTAVEKRGRGRPRQYGARIALSMTTEMLVALDRLAAERGVAREAVIRTAIEREIERTD